MLVRWNRLSAAANRARRVRQWKKISSGERWFSGRERRSKKPVITSLCIRVTHFLFCFYSVISAKVFFPLFFFLPLSCLSFFSPLVIRYFFLLLFHFSVLTQNLITFMVELVSYVCRCSDRRVHRYWKIQSIRRAGTSSTFSENVSKVHAGIFKHFR